MKLAALIVIISVIVACIEVYAYTTQYDSIDLDEILNNDRIYPKYLKCLIGEDKCTPDGKALKDALPDALKTKCAECSEKQKAGAEKVLKFVIKNKPEDFKVIESIYDPDGNFRKMYEEEAKEKGVELPK